MNTKRFNLNKQEWSWALFDWANSAFATTVMAGLFPIFFKNYYASHLSALDSTFYLGLCLSLTGVIVAILNPFLGSLSDAKAKRIRFTAWATALTLFGLLGLVFTQQEQAALAMLFFGVALVGFHLALSFYDSMLNQVAPPNRQHLVSSWGYGLGYLGGGLLFLLNIIMLENYEAWGFDSKSMAVKASFISVIIWWIIFAWPYFSFIKEARPTQIDSLSLIHQIKVFFPKLKIWFAQKPILIFLLAYWLYIDVVYTIMNMATDYGTAIGLESSDLIKALLLVQFLGFPSAIIIGHLTHYFSALKLISCLLLLYLFACLWAMKMNESWEFWILAVIIALAQGGIQSVSRSYFAQLIPAEQSGEGFGLFNLVGRFAAILGPLLIGLITQLTQSHRLAIVSLILPLLVSLFLLQKLMRQT